jgi:hypothetical protein
MAKEQRKPARWQGHIGAGTIPTVIFGTRELFIQRWTYARSDRRTNLIGEAAALVVGMDAAWKGVLSVEDLEFKDDKSVSAMFDRTSHGFVR